MTPRHTQVTEGNAKTAICLVACSKSLLQVSNKINTIQIDSCVKSSVVVESCVASVDIINCKSIEVQITDWTPMVTIDGCAGVIVYLSQVFSRACLCVYIICVRMLCCSVLPGVILCRRSPLSVFAPAASLAELLSDQYTWTTLGCVQRCLDDDISIITSKCSEVNIVLPAKSEQVWVCMQCDLGPEYLRFVQRF